MLRKFGNKMSRHIGKKFIQDNLISEIYGNKSRVRPNNDVVFDDSLNSRDSIVEVFDDHKLYCRKKSKMHAYREMEGCV